MQLLLPEHAASQDLQFRVFAHPRTGRLARYVFAGDTLYELTRVGTPARSAIVDDVLTKDGSMHVATATHPLFLLLPVLYDNRARALPLDVLLELGASSDDADSFPTDWAERCAGAVCIVESGLYQLDLQLLKAFLDKYVQGVRPAIPPGMSDQVLQAVQPIDPREKPAPELVEAAMLYTAVSFVASSWLAPSMAEWYLAQHDFTNLEATAAQLHRLHVEAQAHQFSQLAYKPEQLNQKPGSKAAKSSSTTSRKRGAPVATNNKSILDMFQKRPAVVKKSQSAP